MTAQPGPGHGHLQKLLQATSAANLSRLDNLLGSARAALRPQLLPEEPGTVARVPRRSREVQSTQRRYGTGRSCLLPVLSVSGPGKQAAGRVQGRILPAQPSPALPQPVAPTAAGQGQARPFRSANPVPRDPLPSGRPPRSPRRGQQLPASSAARRRDGGMAGPEPGSRGSPRRGKLGSAGRGPAGAAPARTGSCDQLMAAWQRALSEERRLFRGPRREGWAGDTPGWGGVSCPTLERCFSTPHCK